MNGSTWTGDAYVSNAWVEGCPAVVSNFNLCDAKCNAGTTASPSPPRATCVAGAWRVSSQRCSAPAAANAASAGRGR